MKFAIFFVLALANFATFRPAFASRNEYPSQEQVSRCLQLARNRQGGIIRKVEVEWKWGRWLCEIKLIDPDGRKIKTYVDLDSGSIVRTRRRYRDYDYYYY